MPEKDVKQLEELLIAEISNILSIDARSVSAHTPFHELGMTSLAFVEFLVVIEETLKLKLMETELNKNDFKTVGSLALRISKMQ
jgi:acyl carrier protein